MESVDKTITDEDAGGGASRAVRAPHLFRVLVGHAPLAGGARHRLDGVREITIGRAATTTVARDGAKLALGVPDGRMSTKHVRIVREDVGWFAEDAGSSNGTFVDGERATRTALATGARIEAGSSFFLFDDVLADPSSPLDVDGEPGLATLSPSYAATLDALRRVAGSEVPVLLLGPTGAGKEVVARAVHALSKRAGALVPVNCGALPETLLESQLFGHVKGSFSGAVKDELGLVRAADGGTLFLDEIGDMPKPSQVALLRVLQEREVTPVGATRPVKVDVRVIAATHKPIDALEREGFRSDLYARLAGYTHRLPSLADRIVDLGVLVADILRRVAPDRKLVLTPALVRALVKHPWPLNVRELEQALRVASLLATDGTIDLAHAPESLREPAPASPPPAAKVLDEEDAKIKEQLVAKLREHTGNVTYVARDLGKTRMQIHRWMRRFGIDPNGFR